MLNKVNFNLLFRENTFISQPYLIKIKESLKSYVVFQTMEAFSINLYFEYFNPKLIYIK